MGTLHEDLHTFLIIL